MHGIRKVLLTLDTINELSLPTLIEELHGMVSLSSNTGTRQVHRLPSRESCAWVLSRLLIGCVTLQGLPGIIAEKAASPLTAQLASSLFMPLCSGLLAILARIRALSIQLIIDTARAYNSVAQLISLLPAAGSYGTSSNDKQSEAHIRLISIIKDIVKGLGTSNNNAARSSIITIDLSASASSSDGDDAPSVPLWHVLPQMIACKPTPVTLPIGPSPTSSAAPPSTSDGSSSRPRAVIPSISVIAQGGSDDWEKRSSRLWDELGLTIQHPAQTQEPHNPPSANLPNLSVNPNLLSAPPLVVKDKTPKPSLEPTSALAQENTFVKVNEPSSKLLHRSKGKRQMIQEASTTQPSKPSSSSSFFDTMMGGVGSFKLGGGGSLGLRVFEDKGGGGGGGKRRKKGAKEEEGKPSIATSLLGLNDILSSPLAPIYSTANFSLGI